jgi:hypothetical protein
VAIATNATSMVPAATAALLSRRILAPGTKLSRDPLHERHAGIIMHPAGVAKKVLRKLDDDHFCPDSFVQT